MPTSVYYLLCCYFLSVGLRAQEQPEVLKVRKENTAFYFYQLGVRNDTILKGKTDKFYLVIPDTLDCNVQITLSNGRLARISGNTFLLIPIKNMNYSHFLCREVFDTQLEGTHEQASTTIEISIIDTRNNRRLINNKFVVR